ncbi:MAG TPA: acyl-CoA dehydrogenase [Mycobacteriales bacterium]|nr:acyl-CoA dehydrogenase [Mycobacteriales bacterium]
MHFLPTADQLELQRGVRELLDRRFPLDRLPHGFDPVLWQELTDTGVFALRTDLGLGLPEAVLVFEELGRAGVPGPLVGTFLAGGRAAGPVPVLERDPEPLLLTHRDVAAAVLVLGDDAQLAGVPAGTPVPAPVDPLTPLHELASVPTGEVVGDGLATARLRLEGALLTAAVQVGIAARLTELAVDYAKTREQFGRTIGAFQAVKHICADMFVRAELARVAVHAAAVTLDDEQSGDGPRTVAGAKLLADEAAVTNGRSAVQVHGGMGFTWEVPVHFFLKRAWLHATEFGTADDHAEDLAALL